MGKQTRVGILVLGALVVFMATIVSLGRQQQLFQRKVRYQLHLTRTNGLHDGGQVSLSGVVVGSVEALSFPSDLAARYIEVTIAVNSSVTDRIRADTVASVRTLGLLGDRYIELSPGSPEEAEIPAGGVIVAIDPVDVEQVLGQSGDIVTNVVEVTASLKDVLQTIQRGEGLLGAMVKNREFGETTLRDLESTLANVQGTSRRLEGILTRVDRGEGILGHLVRDTPQSRRMLGNLDRSVASLQSVTERLSRGRGLLVSLVENQAYGERVLTNLDQTIAELREVATKLNRGDGSLGKLVNDPSLYDDARGLVDDVRESWMVTLYRALSGLWPFGGHAAVPARPETQ